MIVKRQLENENTGVVYDVLIGRTQDDNHNLLKSSSQNDFWFHLQDISSPHIILCTKGDTPTKRMLNQVASLFRDFKSNLGRNYYVIYTERSNVQLTKTPGTVIPIKVKTIRV